MTCTTDNTRTQNYLCPVTRGGKKKKVLKVVFKQSIHSTEHIKCVITDVGSKSDPRTGHIHWKNSFGLEKRSNDARREGEVAGEEQREQE